MQFTLKKKSNLALLLGLTIMSMSSCTSQDEELLQKDSTTPPPTRLTTGNQEITGDSILSFASKEDFYASVKQLDNLKEEEKANFIKSQHPGFKSINNIYWEAMNEMASIEDINQESYKAFKTKYNALYFPQYKDDAGFYIPIKDKNLSFFANKNCQVRIAGHDVNLRDVVSYNDLQENGTAMYNDHYFNKDLKQSVPDGYDIVYKKDMNPVGDSYDTGWQIINKRKIKFRVYRTLKYRGTSNGANLSHSFLNIEFCYRKKTWIGWVNYSSPATVYAKYKISGHPWTEMSPYHHNGYSSLDTNTPLYLNLIHKQDSYVEKVSGTHYEYPEMEWDFTINFRALGDLHYKIGFRKLVVCTDYERTLPEIHPHYDIFL